MLITVEETTYYRSRRRQRVIEVPSPQERAEQIRRYIDRVNQFYHQISEWLHEYPNVVITKTLLEMNEEGLDDYWIDLLLITIDTGKYEDEVEIRPGGTTVIMCEGTLEIDRGREFFAYMLTGGPLLGIDSKTGLLKPAYEGIDADGWYWIDRHDDTYAHRVNKALWLKLLSRLSGYDF
jgi:hypothetical protein